jgi:membrane protease YdiL (CAAX protease family)
MRTAPLGRWQLVLLAVLFEGGLAVCAWLTAWLLELPLLQELWWSPTDAAVGVAACVPMLFVFWFCLRSRLPGLVRMRQLCDDFIRPLFAPCSLAELALVALVAGLGEEALFRGVVQPALSDWFGKAAGLFLASLVFGALHAVTATYALLATLLGVYLGGVWLLTGNLLVVIVAHGLYDFFALVYLSRSRAPATGA